MPGRGTYVNMKLDINSETKLLDIFDELAESDEYAFNKITVTALLDKFGI
ncbi:hypothetical protein [Francisella tularensis]|nr:hypothetical protein [Francisella tularensis]MBD2809098.1 hypothetical protein [Francisella tularensis]